MKIGAFTSSTETARKLARLPALIRNHNRASDAISQASANVARMSPRARSVYVKLGALVAEERQMMGEAITFVRRAAEDALAKGKITQQEYNAIAGGGVGALPLLVIPIAVAVAIVAIAGSFAVSRVVSPLEKMHDLRMEQMRLWASLPPAERGTLADLVDRQGKAGGGGGLLASAAAGGGVSLAFIIVGGLVLLALSRR